MQASPYGNGVVLDGLADIAQCVHNILQCERGSDPFRPDMGLGILTYIDRPVTQLGPLKAEIKQQVERWEPRAKVTQVDVTLTTENITFALRWQPVAETGYNEPVMNTVINVNPTSSAVKTWLVGLVDAILAQTHGTGVGPTTTPLNAATLQQLKTQLNNL